MLRDDDQRTFRKRRLHGNRCTRAKRVAATDDELERIDWYWRAANYLSVGQIYLLDNPLLKERSGSSTSSPASSAIGEQLRAELHLRAPEPRDQGLRPRRDPSAALPGGPAMVANTYLEGSYTELYPDISEDEEGMQHLFKQSSRGASRATPRRRHPGRSTRAASSATRSRTPSAPRSTTRTSRLPA